jgi:hypothetical protein
MAALRRRNVLATLLKLAGVSPWARSLTLGPGCTCESCVQAWDRQQEPVHSKARDPRRHLRLGLY